MAKLVRDVKEGLANFRWFTTPTSFLKALLDPLKIYLSQTLEENG